MSKQQHNHTRGNIHKKDVMTLYHGITNIDDEIIEEAGIAQTDIVCTKKSRSKQRLSFFKKYVALAACLCLVIAGSIGARVHLWRSGCGGQIWHNITLSDQNMYYIRNNKGAYRYDTARNVSTKIADFSGTFTRTQSGLLLADNATGELYTVTDDTLTYLDTIAAGSVVVDLVADQLYYRVCPDTFCYTFLQKDLTTQEISEVLTVTNCHIQSQQLLNDRLYYDSINAGDTSKSPNARCVISYDLTSGATDTLYEFAETDGDSRNDVWFFDDKIILQTPDGMYTVSDTDTKMTLLTEQLPCSAGVSLYKDKLYYTTAIPEAGASSAEDEVYDREALIFVDLTSTNVTEVNIPHKTYTELAVCADGYFYTDPSRYGGLFFHPFDGSADTTIYRN